jgi:hypothetical protein
VDEREIAKVPLKIVSVPGDTPAKALVENHRDVIGIDMVRLCCVAQLVERAVAQKQRRRLTQGQVKNWILAGIRLIRQT